MDILDPGSNFQMNGDQGTSRPKHWPEWNSRPVSVKSPIWKDSYIFLRWLTQWNPFWTPGDSRTSWCGVISIGWIQGTSFPSIMDSTPIYGNGKLLEEEINTGCDCCQSQIPPGGVGHIRDGSQSIVWRHTTEDRVWGIQLCRISGQRCVPVVYSLKVEFCQHYFNDYLNDDTML